MMKIKENLKNMTTYKILFMIVTFAIIALLVMFQGKYFSIEFTSIILIFILVISVLVLFMRYFAQLKVPSMKNISGNIASTIGMERKETNKILAVLCMVLSIPFIGQGMISLYGEQGFYFLPDMPIWLLKIAGGIYVSLGLLCFVASYGILKSKKWFKKITIVVAALSLIHIPIGPIIGGILLYYSLKSR